jgi:Fe2+ transport system protein B
MKICKKDKEQLLELYRTKNIVLEGNILKVIEGDDPEFESYINESIQRDRDSRKKRLDITKKIQSQNRELSDLNSENQKIMEELRKTIQDVESSKTQIESQNKELILWREENEKISEDLKNEIKKSEDARLEAERAKDNAENDLDIMQKKTQFELISTIVKVALFVILGVGLITTILYIVAMFTGKDTQIIGSTWSNMFGILLTNAFSIIGTIMGVKYASENSKKEGE